MLAQLAARHVGETGRKAEVTVNQDDVLVVDEHEQYVGYVSPAVARRALREGRIRILRKRPFVLMLAPGESRLPGFAVARSQPMAIMNWFQFFQVERELWVQNTSSTQLSMQFEVGPGLSSGVLLPIGQDPVCITNEVPFESIKKSLDFRKFLNRVPAVMKLLTTEEAHEYFAIKAKALNAFIRDESGRAVPNVAAAIEHAERERQSLKTRHTTDSTSVAADGTVTFAPPRTAQELAAFDPSVAAQMGAVAEATSTVAQGFNPKAAGFANVGDGAIMMEQAIKPRVLHLCQQVSLQLPQNQRMSAEEFSREIKAMGDLGADDLQYIEAHGTYKTVKKWARERQAALNAENEIDDAPAQQSV